jgi:hypothetical protein
MTSSLCVRPTALALACVAIGMSALDVDPAAAHGFAGKRFFPATITNDDPFVADELSLPTASWFKNGERPAEGETDVSVEFSKRILDNLGLARGNVDAPRPPQRAEQERLPELGDHTKVSVPF